MLNLTRQERQVILFLVSVALLGTGINFLVKRYAPIKATVYLSEDIDKINLNKAGEEMLISISGIGEKLAQRIIIYREEHAGFNNIEELKNVKGITGYKYNKIKDYIIIK